MVEKQHLVNHVFDQRILVFEKHLKERKKERRTFFLYILQPCLHACCSSDEKTYEVRIMPATDLYSSSRSRGRGIGVVPELAPCAHQRIFCNNDK
jgi:hypothetical protein